MSSTPAIWSTLRHRQFRALWHSGGIYFIGNAMQVMAAAWMMVELTGSAFLAAAGADGGVPADVPAVAAGRRAGRHHRPAPPDPGGAARRRPSPARCSPRCCSPAGPGRRRCCSSSSSPAAARRCCRRPGTRRVADTVPREELPQAITADRIAYNARARGRPGAGRPRVRLVGGAWEFVLCGASARC